jgi:hypothetical protein
MLLKMESDLEAATQVHLSLHSSKIISPLTSLSHPSLSFHPFLIIPSLANLRYEI